jgi:hypothetical protein
MPAYENIATSAVYGEGTFAPLRLASESPMAMACFLFLTRWPLFPFFRVPFFILCIARLTDRCAPFPYSVIICSFLSLYVFACETRRVAPPTEWARSIAGD